MQETDMKTFLRKIDIRELITRGASNVAPQSPLHAYLHINSNSGLKTKLSCASIDSLDSIISHSPVQLSHDKRADTQLKNGVNVLENKPSVAYDNIPDDVSSMSLSVEEMETDELIYRLCCSLYKKALEKTSIQKHNTDASAAISSPMSVTSMSSSSPISPFVTNATSQNNKPREHGMSAAQIITSYIKEHIRNRFLNVPVDPQHEKNMSKMVAWMPLLHLFDPKTFYALHSAELIPSTTSSSSSSLSPSTSTFKMGGHDVASDRELLMSALPRVICNVTASNPHEASRRLMDELDVEKLPGGNSNHVYRLCHPQFPEKSILLRVYGSGSSEAIDRYRDTAAMKLMSEAALSPAVLHSFKWGRVEEFMSDVYTCTTEMLLASPSLLKEVYQVMHQVHELPFTDFLPESVNKVRYKDYAEYFARVDSPRTLDNVSDHKNMDHQDNTKMRANTKQEINTNNEHINGGINNKDVTQNNSCAMAPSAEDEMSAEDDKFSAYYKLNALRFTNVLTNDVNRVNSLDEIASLTSESAHLPNDDSHNKDTDSYSVNDILHEQENLINNAEYYKDDTESRVMEELCPSSFERAAFRYLRLTSNLIRPEYRSAFDHFVSQAIMELRGWLQERKVPLVFSHNDLNPGNLLLARRKVPRPFRVLRSNPLDDGQSPTASERTLTPSPASKCVQCNDTQEVEIINIGPSNAHNGSGDSNAEDHNSNCSSDLRSNTQENDKNVNSNKNNIEKADEKLNVNDNSNNNDDDDDDEVTPVPSLHSSQLSRKFLTRKGHEKNLVELKGIICIDFEYADVNYRCYDLGNTICELDYDYSKGTEEGEPGFVKFLYTFPPVEYEEKWRSLPREYPRLPELIYDAWKRTTECNNKRVNNDTDKIDSAINNEKLNNLAESNRRILQSTPRGENANKHVCGNIGESCLDAIAAYFALDHTKQEKNLGISTCVNRNENMLTKDQLTEVFLGMLASHLTWALWSFVLGCNPDSCTNNTDTDDNFAKGSSGLDYIQYGNCRLREYFLLKDWLINNSLV